MKILYLSIITLFLISGCSLLSPTEKKNNNNQIYTIQQYPASPQPIIIQEEVVNNPTSTTYYHHRPENKKLREVMLKFDDFFFTQLNLEAQEGEEDMFFDKHIQATLQDLIKETDKLVPLYPQADDRYIALSKFLKKQMIKLSKIIKIKRTDWVKPQVENIINVCNSCHTSYRM